MNRLALGVGVLLISIPLLASDENTTLPPPDPCRSATPKTGCPRIETPPRPLTLVRPDYPRHGRKKKHGLVQLRATVATTGELKEIQSVKGDNELRKAALDAVRQWRYRPSMVNSVPVEVGHDITIDFTKKDGVLLGVDDVSPDLPMEPPEDWYELQRAQGLQKVDGKVKAPQPISTPDPDYVELARRNRYQGICILSMIVAEDGSTKDIWVSRPLGEGLDERAVAVVRTWKFKPATRNNQPVPVIINVEVSFRLY